ncbi:MAG: DUF2695 domain-containing protein [Jiangellaceae bacterium]
MSSAVLGRHRSHLHPAQQDPRELCGAPGLVFCRACQSAAVSQKASASFDRRIEMGIEMSIGDEAEQFLASLAQAQSGPEPHECLRCFLRRAVSRRGCDGGFGSVRRWQLANPGAPPDLIDQLELQGGGCDCEVVLNVFRDEIVPPTRPLADCPSMHPRAGSTAGSEGR